MRPRPEHDKGSDIMLRAADLLYPPRCVLCDRLLDRNSSMVCAACRPKLRVITGPRCYRCGRPLEHAADQYCAGCGIHPRLFSRGFAPFVYDGAVRDAIVRLKYSHRAEYARFFGKAMSVFGKEFLRETAPQAIAAVPIHRERRIRRGYNQAELLAEQLSGFTGIPLLKNRIRRVRGTAPQKELGMRQRRKNLAGAFVLCPGQSFPERILIVDDIFTTGSTIDTVAALLMQAGVREVFFACAAIAAGFSI